MKHATILWLDKMEKRYADLVSNSTIPTYNDNHWNNLGDRTFGTKKPILVNLVHDEWQTEMPSNDLEKASSMAQIQCDAMIDADEMFGLKCPLTGSYVNDGK